LVVALDQFRHLGRTAEFLSVSQPAVSRMLTEVEKMLALNLFDRSTRGTEPTAAGQTLIRFARSVLADFERARDEIGAEASGAAGRTRVGAMVVALPVLLARAVEQIKQRSTQATVLVEEGDLTHLLPKLRLGELDVFVGRLEPGYAAPDLVTEVLFNEPMVVVVKRDHALARKRQPGWGDIANLPCVLPPPWASLRVKIEQTFYQFGLHPPTDVIETASFLALSTFVQQRGAAGFLARSVGQHFEQHGWFKVLPIAVPIELPPIGLITVRGRRLTSSTEQLMGCLRDVSQSMQQAAGTKSSRQGRILKPAQGRPPT
jgi:DNA-binding transcriptional LysR family regulator